MTLELQPDLFGAPAMPPPVRLTGKDTPKGYAAYPGSGPAGETCKTCEFKYKIDHGYSKSFWKCLKAKHKWSHCYASDIRLKAPACHFWEPALSKTPRKLGLGLRNRAALESKELR